MTVFSLRLPIGYFLIFLTAAVYAMTVPLLKLLGFKSSSIHISSISPTVMFSALPTNLLAS